MVDDLAYLELLDEVSFEAERCRLIANELAKAPKSVQRKLVLLQMELDRLRDTLTQEQFMLELAKRASENAENILDLMNYVKNTLSSVKDLKKNT